MTEQINTPEQNGEPQYTNPTARKIMNWMEFLLQLCKLMKSILSKTFLWLDNWETTIRNRRMVG